MAAREASIAFVKASMQPTSFTASASVNDLCVLKCKTNVLACARRRLTPMPNSGRLGNTSISKVYKANVAAE